MPSAVQSEQDATVPSGVHPRVAVETLLAQDQRNPTGTGAVYRISSPGPRFCWANPGTLAAAAMQRMIWVTL